MVQPSILPLAGRAEPGDADPRVSAALVAIPAAAQAEGAGRSAADGDAHERSKDRTGRDTSPIQGVPVSSQLSNTRVARVTGGSGGIGRAVIQRLVRDGFAVALHYAGNKTAAEETVMHAVNAGGPSPWAGTSPP